MGIPRIRAVVLSALLLVQPLVGQGDDEQCDGEQRASAWRDSADDAFASDRHEILDALREERRPNAPEPAPKGIDLGAGFAAEPIRIMRKGTGADAGIRAISVIERPTAPSMRVKLKIEFDVNSATLRPESRPLLEELGAALGDPLLADANVSINGHTDASGAADYNLELSYRRAESVRAYLVEVAGLDPERLEPRGFGEAVPLDDNATAAGRQLNRRVEIERLP